MQPQPQPQPQPRPACCWSRPAARLCRLTSLSSAQARADLLPDLQPCMHTAEDGVVQTVQLNAAMSCQKPSDGVMLQATHGTPTSIRGKRATCTIDVLGGRHAALPESIQHNADVPHC